MHQRGFGCEGFGRCIAGLLVAGTIGNGGGFVRYARGDGKGSEVYETPHRSILFNWHLPGVHRLRNKRVEPCLVVT